MNKVTLATLSIDTDNESVKNMKFAWQDLRQNLWQSLSVYVMGSRCCRE